MIKFLSVMVLLVWRMNVDVAMVTSSLNPAWVPKAQALEEKLSPFEVGVMEWGDEIVVLIGSGVGEPTEDYFEEAYEAFSTEGRPISVVFIGYGYDPLLVYDGQRIYKIKEK